MASLQTLSYSRISTYLSCPLKFYFNYVLGLKPKRTPVALAFGSTIHKAIEIKLQADMEGRTLPIGELQERFDKDWNQAGQEQDIAYKKDDAGALSAQGKALLTTLFEAPKPEGTLVGIEEPFEVQVAPDLPPLNGRIDALYQGEDVESIHVVDFKTASTSYDDGKAQYDSQLSAYALAMTHQGYPVEKLTVGFEVLVKTKVPKYQSLKASRTVAQLAQFVKLASSVYQAVQADVFYPRRDFHCADCQFRAECEAW